MLQVNGKLRGSILVPADAAKDDDRGDRAGQRGLRQAQANGAAPKKVIVVPGRLVNVVV